MLTCVVAGIDGSDNSSNVLDWCRSAFGDTATEVVLVGCHTVRSELGDAGNEALRNEVVERLESCCAVLGAAGVACRPLVVDGDARVALIDASVAVGAELIIVGSRGHSELADLMLGSVASYLTHHAPLPVVVVR